MQLDQEESNRGATNCASGFQGKFQIPAKCSTPTLTGENGLDALVFTHPAPQCAHLARDISRLFLGIAHLLEAVF